MIEHSDKELVSRERFRQKLELKFLYINYIPMEYPYICLCVEKGRRERECERDSLLAKERSYVLFKLHVGY